MTRKYLICSLFAAGLAATSLPVMAQQMAISEMTPAGIIQALTNNGRVSMRGTLFETDSDKLTAASDPVLAKVAASMKLLPEARVAVVGHTDSTGEFAYNVDLSERRAKAVMNALISGHAINKDRLVALGVGSIDPVASNKTVNGRAQNRRVSIVLISDVAKASAAHIFACEEGDNASEEAIEAAAAKWLKAARSMKGGANMQARIYYPSAANLKGGDLLFIITAPSHAQWGLFWDNYKDSPAEKADMENRDVVICPSSNLFETVDVN
jgi:outer membrane protein OmpA-like peptidoglycan-associated protein